MKMMKMITIEEMFKERKEGKCPFCHKTVNAEEFKDELSLNEYHISGLCQQCQDRIFKEE